MFKFLESVLWWFLLDQGCFPQKKTFGSFPEKIFFLDY